VTKHSTGAGGGSGSSIGGIEVVVLGEDDAEG